MAAKKGSISEKFVMNFPANIVDEPVMHTLSTTYNVIPNMLRGRITAKNARLEVELQGSAKNIERALKYLESKGVKIKKID